MKILPLIALASLSLGISASEKILKVPFYFALPEYSHLQDNNSFTKIPIRSLEKYTNEDGEVKTIEISKQAQDNVYLRGYFYKDASSTGRKNALQDLYEKNLIQTGDIVLGFRPSWTDTLPYAHIQMGVSHAGLAYVEDGVVKNLDRPLTGEYLSSIADDGTVQALFTSQFDSDHYVTAPFMHILRLRDFDQEKQENLLAWIRKIKENYEGLMERKQIEFNINYAKTQFDEYEHKDSFITTFARMILGIDKTTSDLSLFCSEQVWTLLSLANCRVDDPDFTNPKVTDAKCVKPIFKAMQMLPNWNTPGLTEGPLNILKSMKGMSLSEKRELVKVLFSKNDPGPLSSGHRALADSPEINALMGALKKSYSSKLGIGLFGAIISKVVNRKADMFNYSPTSFLVNASLPNYSPYQNQSAERDEEIQSLPHPQRKVDYVGTAVFGDVSAYMQ